MVGWLPRRDSNERPFARSSQNRKHAHFGPTGRTVTILAVTPDHGPGYIFKSRFQPLCILLGSIPDASTVPLPGTRLKADLFLTSFPFATSFLSERSSGFGYQNSPRLSWETCGNCLTSNSGAGPNQGDIICCPSREESNGCVPL